jgi:hypothetical protein
MISDADLLWGLCARWLKEDNSYWLAVATLLKCDLKYRLGLWDGRGWPGGV